MAPDDWYFLWEGIQLCIAIQLILLGVLKFFSKKSIEVVLGFLCLIVASYFIKTIFSQFIETYLLFSLFLSGALFFFYGPLLYFYVALIEKSRPTSFFIRHLILPSLLFVLYSIARTFSPSFYNQNALFVNLSALCISTAMIGYYFYLGLRIFRYKLDQSLLLKPRKKFKFFYYAINIFVLNEFAIATLAFFATATDNAILGFIDTYFIHYFAKYLHIPLYMVLSLYLLLYTLSQSQTFKSFFIGHKLHIDQDIIDGKALIEKRIQSHFYENKIYKNPDLKLAEASTKIGMSSKMLTEYLKNEHNATFVDFINALRIEAFKSQLQMPENDIYSIMGLAQDAGFKSKATFYRAFKKKEGITPKEYRMKMKG